MIIRTFLLTILCARTNFGFSSPHQRKSLTPKDAEYWYKRATPKIHTNSYNFRQAKNIILFVGDSMSVSTITGARIFATQKDALGAFESELAFDKFPYSGFVKTHCLDRVTADSGCSATAYLGGVKANYGTVGVSGIVTRKDCKKMLKPENKVSSIARLFQLNGKRTGLVTTSSVTEASASALYAHSADRNWMSDTDVINDEKDPKKCLDIASQLIYGDTGRNLNVIFGGGRKYLLPDKTAKKDSEKGIRSDGRNLINEWHRLKAKDFHYYVSDLDGLFRMNHTVKYVLGLFAHDRMPYNVDRVIPEQPSLKELTKKAIRLLSQDQKGYFLFVESGRMGHAHGSSKAQIALDEMLELDKAVEVALKLTDSRNTLIVLEYSLTKLGEENDSDGYPYAVLNYASGPGFKHHKHGRHNLTKDDFDVHYKYPALFPSKNSKSAPHDVAIFASGPWSHLFSGVIEQYLIPHKMACAAGLRGKFH
ncbi:hypothetical protein FQR65_LT10530 [Abscondita terminalis]|nr:hypothetical protein FQR65_LT10530 [Abscondita terminalis]